jgi:hypothetical protein
MKMKVNKHISLVAGIVLLAGLSSCIKDKGYANETDFSGLQDHVDIVKGGTTNFGGANVAFNNGDTNNLDLIVNLASVDLPKSPVDVTIAVDPAALAKYNTANGTSYVAMPTNAYKIASTKLTIPAGQQYAHTTVSVYKPALDPTVSYMLPISITDASGKALSSNLNTIYYHVIGNPLAGKYTWNFTRWSSPDSTTAPDGNSFTGHTTQFVPDNSTQIEVASGYYIGPRYVLSFTNNNGVLSNFKVKLNADDVATMTAGGVTVTYGPVILLADPVNKHFRFYYTTVTRAVIDEYYK